MLPGSKWDFEGDFATLDFVVLPMINEVDVRDERKDKQRKEDEREEGDSKGRDKKQRMDHGHYDYIKKNHSEFEYRKEGGDKQSKK